jgi:hypothetical protein
MIAVATWRIIFSCSIYYIVINMYVELHQCTELSRFDLVVYSKFAVTIHVSFAE